MNEPLKILVATHYKPLVALIERATHGAATVLQVTPHSDSVLGSVGINDKSVVVLHVGKGGEEWLEILKSLHESCPTVKAIAFGDAADVGAIATGIANGLSGYVPMNLGTDLMEVKKYLTGGMPSDDCVYGRVKNMLPVVEGGAFLSHSGKTLQREEAIQKCHSLGLTPKETARYLEVSLDDANAVASKASRKIRSPLQVTGRLKVMGGILAASLALMWLMGQNSGKHFIPVSGTVTLDGRPLGDVIVYFSRDGASHVASGKTDAAGRYRLSTMSQGDGAEEGAYVVWLGVPSRVRDHIDMNDPQYTEKMVQLREKMRAERESDKKEENEGVPAAYRDMQTSPLRAEVKGTRTVTVDVALKS